MTRIALILLFSTAVFLTAFAVMNPDSFFRAQEPTTATTKAKSRTGAGTEPGSSECLNCPLPSN